MPVLVSDRVNFGANYITKDKEGHFMMIKVLIHQDDITILKAYVSNKGTSKYTK